MTKYYSPSTKGFYNPESNHIFYPDDIIEISDERHMELLYATHLDGKEIYVENGEILLRDRTQVVTWQLIRNSRNRLLKQSDYTQMPDWPGDKQAWAEYRQALRDLPQMYENPSDVNWPTAPGE